MSTGVNMLRNTAMGVLFLGAAINFAQAAATVAQDAQDYQRRMPSLSFQDAQKLVDEQPWHAADKALLGIISLAGGIATFRKREWSPLSINGPLMKL